MTVRHSITAPSRTPFRVLILGASGELGGALANIYAKQGHSLSLWGRNASRLAQIADRCLERGAVEANIRSLDLEDLEHAIATLTSEDEAKAIDVAIFAAGLGDIRETGRTVESAELVARLGRVNFLAPAALSAELATRMIQRGKGRIALIGSAAGFHSLPFSAAYAGSKAGLARFADALRIAAQPHGVSITLVSPGFIDTATARRVPGPKPFALSAEEAAARIAKATAGGKPHLIMPWPFALLRLIDRALPKLLRDRLLCALTPPGH